jgi:hypothetical protein
MRMQPLPDRKRLWIPLIMLLVIWLVVLVRIGIFYSLLPATGTICEPGSVIFGPECRAYGLLTFLALKAFSFVNNGSSLWVAIFTGLLWWTSTRQYVVLERSTRAAIIAAEAATRDAKTAQESVETLKRTERAYVFVDVQFDSTSINSGRAHLSAAVSFWNYGKTPAPVRMIRAYLEMPSEIPQSLLPGNEMPLPPAVGIAPNESYLIRVQLEVSAEQWENVKCWNETLYCVGTLLYDDVLGEPHETGFCWNLLYQSRAPTRYIPTRGSELNRRT